MMNRAQLKAVFSGFDEDNNGFISVQELGNCLRKLGQEVADEDIAHVIGSSDLDCDGKMNFEEFCAMVESGEEEEESTRQAFTMFDKNGDGHITKEELKQVMTSLGDTPTDEELDIMFRDADDDGDGRITFDEFKRMVETEE